MLSNNSQLLFQDLKTFEKIYEVIVSKLNLNDLAQNITDIAAKHLSTTAIVLTLLTPDKKYVYAHTISSGLPAKILTSLLGKNFQKLQPIDKDYTLTIKSIRNNKIYTSENISDMTSPPVSLTISKLAQTIYKMKGSIVVPISLDDKPLGAIICAFTKTVNEITEHEIYLIEKFAKYIAYAIERSQLYERERFSVKILEAKNRDLQSLFTLTTNVIKSLDPNEVAQIAVNSLPQTDTLLGAVISLLENGGKTARVKAVTSNPLSDKAQQLVGAFNQINYNLDDPGGENQMTTEVIKYGNPVFSDNLEKSLNASLPIPILDKLQKLLQVSVIAGYPLYARGKVVGSIIFFLKNIELDNITDSQKQLLKTYSLQISIALENANLYKTSKEAQENLQKALNELTEARRRERDMIDVMGHELRTPLSIVRNALVILDNEYKDHEGNIEKDKLGKYLEIAVESARRETALVETLLAATKIEGNRVQLLLTKVDLIDVVNDSIEALHRMANEKNIEIEFIKPGKNIYVYSDRTRTQEIMDNILNNAIKYTLKGKVTITMFEDEVFGTVSVKDTGVGISEEDIANLGKKFFRAREVMSEKQTEIIPGGTGLGLYVVFELIKAMNGEKKVESTPGKGSTFSFSLPIYTNQPDKAVDQNYK